MSHSTRNALHAQERPSELEELIVALGHQPSLIGTKDLQEIADRLSEMARKETPWGWRYLHGVLRGKQAPSQKLTAAIRALGAHLDGLPVEIASAHPVQVYTTQDVTPGSLVLVGSRRCAYPPCGIHFVPTSHHQRFHREECRRANHALRRSAERNMNRRGAEKPGVSRTEKDGTSD